MHPDHAEIGKYSLLDGCTLCICVGFSLVPSVMLTLNQDQYIGNVPEFAEAHTADMQSADTLKQELVMWRTKVINKQSAFCKTLIKPIKWLKPVLTFRT